MKSRLLIFPLSLVLASSAMAGQFIWTGATDSTWTTASNWDITTTAPVSTDTYPNYGTTYASDFLNIKNNGDLLPPTSGSTPGFGAVYDPGAGVTTVFSGGRCFTVGTGTPGTNGSATLEVRSGTIAAVRSTNSGSEPYLANRANTLLWINGGTVDLSGSGVATSGNGFTTNNFRLIQEGQLGMTSTITITSGSLSCNLLDLYYDAENDAPTAFGDGIINLDGGVLALNRFGRTFGANPGQTSFKINLNGGTLRCRNSNANFLPSLADTDTIVKIGGAKIDTNTFSSSIAEVLEHDATLGAGLDGGLTKIGRGNLTLSGVNTFNGGITINAGTALAEGSRIILGNDIGAGGGSITFADSYTELQLGVGRNIANPLVISNTGDEKTIYFVNAGAAECSGPITINESNIDHFRVRADDNCFLTFSGKISGPGGIYRFQNGSVSNSTLYLTNAANDFTGGAKITLGTLSFVNGGLGTSGAITMDGGSLRWDPTNNQDVSSRIVMVTGKAATFALADGGTPYDIATVTFASAIGNSSTAALVKSGNGTLTLTQPSTYSGGTTVTQGTLGFPAGGLGITGNVTMNGGTLRWETGNTEDVSARLVMVNAKTATFSTNGNNVAFASAIGNLAAGNLAKSGSGTLTLSGTNTYTGTTVINQGALSINSIKDYAVSSAIGAPASGNIQLGSGSNFTTLSYTGAGDSTNRTVQLGDGTAANTGVGAIQNNGTGALTFTAANLNPTIIGITATRTLWLGGSYTGGPNEIQGIIQDNDTAGKVNVGKANDASIWMLSGANTYTGNTIVQGGTLKLGAAGSITTSASATINAGATLDTSAQATYTVPGAQPLAFGIDATGSGSSGKIAAAGLNISAAVVTYNITGTPDDPVYVLATYTPGLLSGTFASVPTPPAGYALNYAYEGNKIALVQSVVSGYAAWQSANSTAQAINLDHDNDGVSNGVEYFLFGNANTSGFTALPGVTNTAGTLSITWTKAATYTGVYGTDFWVETSATLASPWTTEASGVDVTFPSATEVKYTFPAGTTNFARLKVTGP